MSTLDLSQPLELDDGTPVVFNNYCGDTWINVKLKYTAKGHPIFTNRFTTTRTFNMATGKARASDNPRSLRNCPAVDWNAPLELCDGTPLKKANYVNNETRTAIDVETVDGKPHRAFENSKVGWVSKSTTQVGKNPDYRVRNRRNRYLEGETVTTTVFDGLWTVVSFEDGYYKLTNSKKETCGNIKEEQMKPVTVEFRDAYGIFGQTHTCLFTTLEDVSAHWWKTREPNRGSQQLNGEYIIKMEQTRENGHSPWVTTSTSGPLDPLPKVPEVTTVYQCISQCLSQGTPGASPV